ncbi:MAG TPA: beta-galactosidase trimerization domain-containing protein, partial [Bryobacteraceae bacterium]|nr:beta-galactosidase trimerization domain-containing protein [Bryobacteraceae bacterium]
ALARHCAELYDFLKSANPKLAVGFNLKGIYGVNRIWRNAVYHPFFEGKIDFSPFDVGGMDARLDSRTGAMVSEIRSYKMARTLNFSYQEGGNALEFALCMAFNPQKYVPGYGYEGGPSGWGAARAFSPEAEFFREYNDRYYTETENVADVAVVRTWPSMAYSVAATLVPTILIEQVLIQHKVPFDILFDGQIDRIDRYRAVILPGQESLSQEWVDRLSAYVRGGGTLVFTGNTADFNERRERRAANPLLALMGAPARPAAITVKTVGQGKVVCIPEVGRQARGRATAAGDETEVEVATGGRADFPASQWLLPPNHEEIHHAIADNARGGLSIASAAPLNTVMELLNRKKSSETIVHFVNFEQGKRLDSFEVRLRKQFPGKVSSVKVFSPDSDEPISAQFKEEAGRVVFQVPSMGLYSMAVVSHQP